MSPWTQEDLALRGHPNITIPFPGAPYPHPHPRGARSWLLLDMERKEVSPRCGDTSLIIPGR